MSDFVRVNIVDESIYDTIRYGDGSFRDAIAHFVSLFNTVPDEYKNAARFEIEYERGYYDSSDSATLKIWYERPKTTTELVAEEAERTERVRKSRLRTEERERQQLAALKAKYDVA